jgi:formylglycine-generating enzyme required for sulfatase activity
MLALNPKPEDRFQTVEELRAALSATGKPLPKPISNPDKPVFRFPLMVKKTIWSVAIIFMLLLLWPFRNSSDKESFTGQSLKDTLQRSDTNTTSASTQVEAGQDIAAEKTAQATPEQLQAQKLKTILENIQKNMVFVQGGTFIMGCTSEQGSVCEGDESPAHQVTVSSFRMGKYEVTQAEWEAVMGSNPSYNKNCQTCPVENVSWNDVQYFTEQLNKLTGGNYRLPTEAEWEYAARGGIRKINHKYSGSDNVDLVGWCRFVSIDSIHTYPVGLKKANFLGLYDMTGNVWEWCSDRYDENYYSRSPSYNPQGPKSGNSFVVRGGRVGNRISHCRVSKRDQGSSDGIMVLGFRLAEQL